MTARRTPDGRAISLFAVLMLLLAISGAILATRCNAEWRARIQEQKAQ